MDHEGASPHTQTPSPLGFALLAQTNQTKPVRRAVSHLYPLILFLLREYFRPRSRIYPCLMSNLLYSRRVVFLQLDPPLPPPHHVPTTSLGGLTVYTGEVPGQRGGPEEEMMADLKILGGAHQAGREPSCISGINECFALDQAQDNEGAPDNTKSRHQDQTLGDMISG